MPTRQAAAIVQAVAEALHIDADPSAWSSDLRRNGVLPTSLTGLAEHVAELGRRAQLTMLNRDVPMLDALVDAAAFPIIVLAEPAPQRYEAWVLTGRDGRAITACAVAMDGSTATLTLPTSGLAAALGAHAREAWPGQARGDGATAPRDGKPGAVPLRVLVPVSVVPTVGGSQNAIAAGVAAAHGRADLAADDHGHADAHGPTPLERFWALVTREKRDVLLVFGYAALAGLFSLALPLGIQQIVQLVSGRMLLQPTYILIAFVVLGTVVVGALQVMQLSVVETIQQRVFARLALEFAYRVPRLRHDVATSEDLPEAMNRFFETVTIQKSLSKLLLDLSTALLTILFGLILLTLYHPYFTFFSAALVVGLGLIFWITGPKGLQTNLYESKYKYRAVHWLEEMARATTAFKYAGRSTLPIERMDELVSGYLKYRRRHFRVLVQQTISIIGFKTLIVGTLLVLGIVLVQDNQITLGQFVASEIVIVTVLAGIEKLVTSLATVYDVLVAVDKIGHVTDLPLEATGGMTLPVGLDQPHGLALSVRGLSFRYAARSEPAVRGIDLTVRPGERIGITGYDGSGQTTLIKVLGGLLDGFEGAIAVNGIPMRDLDRSVLRDSIGQFLSPTDLFDGTVEENITVGRPHVTPHMVLDALRSVGLEEWIQGEPGGLRTPIVNGGRALPTHVVSRLLMAQAIVGHPRMVVVDDYYQNVEPDCRLQLAQSLTDRERRWTLLLVSHDPAFLAACDRVLVLEGGRIVRDAPFQELLEENAFVQRLVQRAGAFSA